MVAFEVNGISNGTYTNRVYFSVATIKGLNRLVAIALLFLSELDAFWCLVAIIEHILPPEYFTNTLAAAQVDQVRNLSLKILVTNATT